MSTTICYDWVQVVDPISQHTFFANPTTGEWLADKPDCGTIKPIDPEGEWWELWDDIQKMPYYYHTLSNQTRWIHPPAPVISLIKIQQESNIQLHVARPTEESCSLLDDTIPKRNSRSLDLTPMRTTVVPPTSKHQRSPSDGTGSIRHAPTTTTTTMCQRQDSQNSLSDVLPGSSSTGLFGFRWARKQSVCSEEIAGPMRRLSTFSALKHTSPWKNLVTRSVAVSSPVNNPDAAQVMRPGASCSSTDSCIMHGGSLLDQATINDNATTTTTMMMMGGETRKKPALPTNLQQEITQFAIDGFAKKYFATHKRGLIFRRQVPMNEMLQWTRDGIKQPLMMLNRDLHKDALKCFKTIQTIMGDRPRHRQSSEIDEYQYILSCGISKGQMRDEIYVQLCKQLHKNPTIKSIQKGWEILCVVSMTFPPSKNLESYLNNFVDQHKKMTCANKVDIMSEHVSRKLERICARGAKGKVLTAAEIDRAKEAPFKPSVFGESLDLIMSLPVHCDNGLKIPKIVPFLADAVLQLNGKYSEGIFRVPGDAEEVTDLRIRIENGNYDACGITDPNVPASLLKYWLRDLEKPLITAEYYDRCIQCAENPQEAIAIVNALPEVNRRIVMYMIAFVQDFNQEDVTQHTRMNVHNLAMVYAPNFLRCPSDSLTTVFENSKYEQAFVRTLITQLETDKHACAYADICPTGIIKKHY
ncbi:hypothetical protein LRAMOSA04590 [Lichtheimia ramosa]|uniref:Rho-GAP domain-containing protein n=1 Tax=Lichtheimia ramosa TaxID=688394 RepID=A0A077WXM1_9FUNG|nr:hypothetical protein LRAMOSA04590 [Lichtheimia ramosa]